MEKNFAMGYDGFVQIASKCTLEEVKNRWIQDIKNRSLYQYDCAAYELNEDNSIKRRLDRSEIVA